MKGVIMTERSFNTGQSSMIIAGAVVFFVDSHASQKIVECTELIVIYNCWAAFSHLLQGLKDRQAGKC